MGAPSHCYTGAGGGEFLESWGVGKAKWYCVLWLRLQAVSNCIPHPYHMYTKCLSTVDGHMGAPLYCYSRASGDEILRSWGVGESEWCCVDMVESTNSFRRHPTSISYV
jgi:hypothetical protein